MTSKFHVACQGGQANTGAVQGQSAVAPPFPVELADITPKNNKQRLAEYQAKRKRQSEAA